ncbi:MAG TPA: NUDIX hydrolase [Polyangiales bacterium]|jgi:8-oxo-dGTP pyrophosphatase MutT (NUDIX family)|nr:NUDIX hydrolase [Polyangiales bacterium]
MINALIRAVYRVAHWGLRLLWFIRRPETTGALVAVWYQGRVLLVKNSYRAQLTLPGGYIRPREERRVAAARELREEVGITVQPKRLVHAYHGTHLFEHRKDTLDIYELEVEDEPKVLVDEREVVRAEFHTPDEALNMQIVPHLEEYLARRLGQDAR